MELHGIVFEPRLTPSMPPCARRKDDPNVTVFFINEGIEDPENYSNVVRSLLTAKKGSIIKLYINTPGGNVNAAKYITDAMMRSEAEVYTFACGMVASAGAMIWGYGKKRGMGKFARVMFHGSSHGSMGNSVRIKESATNLVKSIRAYFQPLINNGVLLEDEVDSFMEKKRDLYFNHKELASRGAINV